AAGLLMSLAFVLAVFGWFAAAIGTYTGAPSPVALVLLLAAAPLLEPQLLAFALARHLARRAAFGFWRATLACACAYVGSEWALPKLFGDTLGHGLYASAWMRQAADLAGAAGLTFLLVVANECALAGLRGLVAGPGLRRALAPAPCVVTLAFETYRKASLFPLTERVPVALESEWLRRWLPWLGTWAAGAGARVVTLALPDGRMLHVAPLICYDVLDPRLALGAARRGAELIVTLSNDSWFAEGPGPRLHLVGAAFLSIETRRPQLRATNTGISAVIAPTGEVLDALGVDQRGTQVATVRPEIPVTALMVVW